jgi:cytochrome b561
MPLRNSSHRYGSVTKLLHWSVFLLFVFQYVAANIMTHMSAGRGQNFFFDWHKSVGLVLLVLMLGRLAWRSATPLPDWSPMLSEPERRLSHRLEMLMYAVLLMMPISGYLFVMAGDFGVRFFGTWHLPNPIGKRPGLAGTALALHVILAYAALVVVSWHVGHVLKKHCYDGCRYLQRMLPLRRAPLDPGPPPRPAESGPLGANRSIG